MAPPLPRLRVPDGRPGLGTSPHGHGRPQGGTCRRAEVTDEMETHMSRFQDQSQGIPDTADAGSFPQVNVGDNERWLSAVGGGAVALYGLKRGGLGGALLLAVGGALVYRG